jgi:pimeloyl-ACP methyl ester carboxylesterase
MKNVIVPAFLLLFWPGLPAGPAAEAAPSPALTLQPCEIPGVEPPAECGQMSVPEDRTRSGDRTIDLAIVRLGAAGERNAPDPLFVVLGGPGVSVTESARGVAAEFAAVRRDRALVLVDQRGTGGSHPLDCPFYTDDDPRILLGEFIPLDSIRACRPALERRADLTRYTTRDSVEDLDAVRRALGYERINLYGLSYGTRVVLDYARRHPSALRSAVLQGMNAPGQLGRLHLAPNAQRALEGVLADCRADERCANMFPRIGDETRTVFERLRRKASTVPVIDPRDGEEVTVSLTHEIAGEAVRYMLYQPGTAAFLPRVLHQAAQGDLQALAEFAVFARRRIVDSGGNGLYLTVTCSEDLARADPAAAARNAAGTFWSDYHYRQLFAACAEWVRAEVPEGFHEFVESPAPVLLLSGQWDPATPPAHGEEAAAHLPNSRHVVVPQAGHSIEGLEGSACIRTLVADFYRQRSVEQLDARCAAGVRRAAFMVEPLPMARVDMSREALARFAGRYRLESPAMTISIEPAGSALRLVLPDGTGLLHVPVSATRFRAVGLLGFHLTFDVGDGVVRGASLYEPGSPPLPLVRTGER